MITEKEQQLTELSATKKDFYQIWQELLDTAGKISERWDPTSTNESDPGIVLLKVLTGIADKLNYNIDKNTLEAFMPSAAQEESMRKLCDMMGYSMKYYRSATTDVTVYYNKSSEEWSENTENNSFLVLPKFTQFTNIDKDIIYTSTEDVTFTLSETLQSVPCIEGTIKHCAEDTSGVINLNNIDDNNRYYLPITQIAENGVFVYNTNNGTSNQWKKVDNLNTQELGKRVFKFGYDSKKFLPYIEFPDDIGSLIEDGLSIDYISTNGINGNVSAKTLIRFDTPSEWNITDNTSANYFNYNSTGKDHTSDEFICYNASASTGGTDKESLNNAYKNFKKTVGTFDTLVTCRDYMNKIYTLTKSETDTTPLVSNSIVSDIRDDINRSITICSFNRHGIIYNTKSLTKNDKDQIDHFDLMLYPFQTVYGLDTKDEYVNSFKQADIADSRAVMRSLSSFKTIAHKINLPDSDELMCIKIYLELKAQITTNTRINSAEWNVILNNIKKAIYKNFNCRQLDFSERIPNEDILNVIENADANIKNVSLDDPDIYASFMTAENKEYWFKVAKTTNNTTITTPENNDAKKLYNKLAIRNILAGRVSLFNYDTDFKTNITETKITGYNLIYPSVTETYTIESLKPELTIKTKDTDTNYELKDLELTENQIVQFSAPNFKTEVTYPAYVNYFIKLNNQKISPAIPATFESLKKYMTDYEIIDETRVYDGSLTEPVRNSLKYTAFNFTSFMNKVGNNSQNITKLSISTIEQFISNPNVNTYGGVFSRKDLIAVSTATAADGLDTSGTKYYWVEGLAVNNRTANKINMTGNIYEVILIPEEIDSDTSEIITPFKTNLYYYNNGYKELTNDIARTESMELYLRITPRSEIEDAQPENYPYYYVNIFNKTEGSSTYDGLVQAKPGDVQTDPLLYIYSYHTEFQQDITTYYIYPLTNDTYGAWFNWIKNRKHFQNTVAEKTCFGLYMNLGSDQSRNIGYLVDENKNKYQLSNSYFASATPLTSYYVPTLHYEKTLEHTADGLGEDAVYQPLTKNMEYQLKEGKDGDPDECLYINYTKASSTVSETGENSDTNTLATTNEVINQYYGPGTIIRPNFDLKDSLKLKSEGKSYSRTNGFNFKPKDNPSGMFTLGANEQIEIREQVKTFIYDPSGTNPVYIYFNINKPAVDGVITLMTMSEPDNKYILQEGEYFWYTDKNKQTLTYCGAGSELINYTNQNITKNADNDISTEKIFENGLSAINWIAISNLDKDRYIEWDEYQYINLTAGDILNEVKFKDKGESSITKTPKQVDSAIYTIDGVKSELPKLAVKDSTWKVRSKLALNIGPNIYQTLSNKNGEVVEELILNTKSNDSYNSISITPAAGESVDIKSNYLINSTLDMINTIWKLYDEDTGLTEEVNDFKLKVFKNNPILKTDKDGNTADLLINNLNNYYTSLSTTNCKIGDASTVVPFTTIYSTIDNTNNKYNLLMIYYETDTPEGSMVHSGTIYPRYASIKITKTDTTNNTTPTLAIFNNIPSGDTDDAWWTGRTIPTAGLYCLNPGLNIIKIKGAESAKLELYAGTIEGSSGYVSNPNDTLVIGQLDTVKVMNNDLGLNLNLIQYQDTSDPSGSSSKAEQLLKAIRDIDTNHEFYYNALLDNSLAININTLTGETLADPQKWYDYNNINNKFVISEIKPEFKGITLVTSSRK